MKPERPGAGAAHRAESPITEIALCKGAGETRMMPSIGRLFPNPTRHWLAVELEGEGPAEVPVQLFDALGRLVRIFTLRPGLTELSLAGLPAGAYTLRGADRWERIVVE